MLRFSAQDCPPVYLIGGTTAFGIATGCSLAISPLVAAAQSVCLLPYLDRPHTSVSLLDKKTAATPTTSSAGPGASNKNDSSSTKSAGSALTPQSSEADVSTNEIDRLLPGRAPAEPAKNRAGAVLCTARPARILDEYRAILKRAWSGAPELDNIYPSASFYGHLQPTPAELSSRIDRIQLAEAPPQGSATTASLAEHLAARASSGPAPILFLTLCADEMQTAVSQCDPEALKCAGGDAGVVAARMAADQVAALLEQVGQFQRTTKAAATPTTTTVVIIADDLCRAGLLRYAADLEARVAQVRVTLLYTWVPELSPPALDSGLTEASVRCAATGLDSSLVSLCTSVTLGLQRTLDVPRAEDAPFVPVDVAVNVALMEVLLGRASAGAATTGTPTLTGARAMGLSSVAAVSIGGTPSSRTVVWGMVAEYLLDYVARYAERIRAVFPAASTTRTVLPPPSPPPSPPSSSATAPSVSVTLTMGSNATGERSVPLLDPNPTLQFSASRANFLHGRYGVGMTTPVPCLLARHAHQREVELLSTTSYLIGPQRAALTNVQARAQQLQARAMTAREAVAQAVAGEAPRRVLSTPALIATAALVPGGTVLVAAELAKKRAAASKSKKSRASAGAAAATAVVPPASLYAFTTQRYETLLARLAQAPALAPYLQFVALGDVDWGMYVRLLARAALFHLARFVVGVPDSDKLAFPAPTRLFVNDITFHGPDRAPPQVVSTRRWVGEADWFTRAGTGATGELVNMTPGMSGRRLATILEQPGVRTLFSTVAANEGVTIDVVEKRAKKILLRLGDTQAQVPARTIGLLVRQLFFKVYDRVNVTRNGFAYLRRLYQRPRTQVVLVPQHRSYSDFLVMTYMLASMALPIPHIVAGEDFLGMGKFAELLRGSGAFFMRRSFRGDPLYGGLFREYVRQLVYHGQSTEFFIEGTRSRTNKTMVPKLGILKFISDALYEGSATDVDDVLIVPVSLSYDELLEAGVYAKELLGIPKPRESVPNMIKAGLSLDRLYGSINVAFGDPISLCAFRANPTQCPPGFAPKAAATRTATATSPNKVTSPSPRATAAALMAPKPLPKAAYSTPAPLLTALGWRIAYDLQKNIVVTPSALVAAVLECFGARAPTTPRVGASTAVARVMPSIAMGAMVERVEWLRAHLRVREAHLSRELATWTPRKVTQGGLDRLVRFVRTRTESTPAPATTTPAAGASVKASTTTTMVVYDPPTITSRLGVNISANQLIHLFIDEAVISLIAAVDGAAVVGRDDRLVPKAALATQARFLTTVLAREFPNFLPTCPWSFESWLAFAVGRVQRFGHLQAGVPTTVTTSPSPARDESSVTHTAIPAARLFHFHLQLVAPHIEAAYFVACALQILLVESPSASGVPARSLLEATHHAAIELSGEEVPKRRGTSPTRSSTSTSSSGDKGDVKTVASMAASMASSVAAATSQCHVLQHTSATCNKEILSHYLEAMSDVGAVSLVSDSSVLGGKVYRVKEADVLQKMVDDLGRYVIGSEGVLHNLGNPVTLHGEAATKTMKSVVWKHYNEIASKPKL